MYVLEEGAIPEVASLDEDEVIKVRKQLTFIYL